MTDWQKIRAKISHTLTFVCSQLGCCDLCNNPCSNRHLICQHCMEDLPRLDYQATNNNLLNWPAIEKLFTKRFFDQLIAVAPYEWPFDHWLKQFKFNQRFELATLFAMLCRERLAQIPRQDLAIVSVPSQFETWRNRGYNQAHLIAKHLAKRYKINYLDNVLYRNSNSQRQLGLTGAQRRKNLTKAFELIATQPLPEHVVLVDDVITTGSTVNAISQLLKKQGVRYITVLTVAISLPH